MDDYYKLLGVNKAASQDEITKAYIKLAHKYHPDKAGGDEKRFKEEDLLIASSNALQDLGFNLDNSETKLGVLTASKKRDATDGGEVAAAIFIALLGGGATAISKDQTIRVALVIRPVNDSNGKAMVDSQFVRVSFQRVVRKSDNSTFSETLRDDQLFKDFYERVSKAVFLEAQKI